MKTMYVIGLIAVVLFMTASLFEWRYSDDMEAHIMLVNTDLESARSQAAEASGMIRSIQAITATTEVAREIMETRDHVHTLKDEVLARKVKKSVEDSITVGDAMRDSIQKWPENVGR